MVRLALAEATVPQMASFTGHSLKDVEAILDAHYLGRDVQPAEVTVLKNKTLNRGVLRLLFAFTRPQSRPAAIVLVCASIRAGASCTPPRSYVGRDQGRPIETCFRTAELFQRTL